MSCSTMRYILYNIIYIAKEIQCLILQQKLSLSNKANLVRSSQGEGVHMVTGAEHVLSHISKTIRDRDLRFINTDSQCFPHEKFLH